MMEHNHVAAWMQEIRRNKAMALIVGKAKVVDTDGKPSLAYRAKRAGESAQRTAHTTRREARHAAKAARREARLKVAQAQNALS